MRFDDVTRFDFPHFLFYLEAFRAYDEHGVLPDVGSFFEQPAHIMEIFAILKAIQSEEAAQAEKEHQRQLKKETSRSVRR